MSYPVNFSSDRTINTPSLLEAQQKNLFLPRLPTTLQQEENIANHPINPLPGKIRTELLETLEVKTSYKKTSELTRRLMLIEEHKALKRHQREQWEKYKRTLLQPKPQIVPSVTDAIKDEEYVEPDPATLDRLIMKTTNAKTPADNKCPDAERELRGAIRCKNLERAGLMLDSTDEAKVQVYVDFYKDQCRNIDDSQEVMYCAWGALILRNDRREYANPKEKPAQGMMRVGLTVATESIEPEVVFEDAIRAAEYLGKSRKCKDMDYPIGYENVTLNLIHHGFPANGSVPSSVGKGILLYEL